MASYFIAHSFKKVSSIPTTRAPGGPPRNNAPYRAIHNTPVSRNINNLLIIPEKNSSERPSQHPTHRYERLRVGFCTRVRAASVIFVVNDHDPAIIISVVNAGERHAPPGSPCTSNQRYRFEWSRATARRVTDRRSKVSEYRRNGNYMRKNGNFCKIMSNMCACIA